jgi:Tol biopolymer transport system component
MPLQPGTRIGPYEILAPIGAGGMGEVYRARDERLARDVAVKILPPAFRGDAERLRRFEQEARATGQLNHPNILAVHDVGAHEGAPYVVEELLEGETLRQRMAGSPLPARKALEFAAQISQGLAAAHAKGIVHRDLKPDNIFVTRDGRVKILDFGLAKLARVEPAGAALTEAPTRSATGAGTVLGTAGYMSPEQVRGLPVDHRSDIFSFGSILYEMLTGRRAFQAASSVETMNAILKEDPPEFSQSAADAPAGLERILRHCLEKSPDERFQSARDLAFQIEALLAPPASSAAVAPLPAAGRAASRGRLRAGAALAAGLLAVAGAFVAGRSSRPAAAPATYDQLTFRQGSLFSARFTPDGETVVYAAAWDGKPTELFTTLPGNPESRALHVPSAELLSISRSGEMAILIGPRFVIGWQREGTLARATLAGGVPRELMEGVQDADWAPDGETLAVVRYQAGRCRLEYPTGRILHETSAWIDAPRFSPDGRRIAFIDHPANGDDRGRIAVVDLEGRTTPLSEMFSSASGLEWSPSGAEIWFTAGRTGNVRALHAVDLEGSLRVVDGAPADLVLMDVSPRGTALIARNTARRGIAGLPPGAGEEVDLSWLDWSRPAALSRDGRWLLIDEQGQGGGPGYSVYLRRTDGSPAVRLGAGQANDLSPDGRWAAATSLGSPDRLLLLPTGPGEARAITFPGLEVSWGNFFPDGDRLLIAATEQGRPLRLYEAGRDGGRARPITPEGIAWGAAVSPDGRRVVSALAGEAPRIFPVEGGEPRPVPGLTREDAVAGFGDDGRTIFVIAGAGASARIDRLDLETGARTPLREIRPVDRAGLIDLGFFNVSADASAYVYSYRRVLSTLYLVEGLR